MFKDRGHMAIIRTLDTRVYVRRFWPERPVAPFSMQTESQRLYFLEDLISTCWPAWALPLGHFHWHNNLVSQPTYFHSFASLFDHLCEIGRASKCIAWVFTSRGTWWPCFTVGFTCYSWSLSTPRRLGASRIVELRLVIVFGSDRSDFEGFLTFPWRRAKRYSSGLLMACVSLILCWLCGTLVRVWHVMSIRLWISKWVYYHNED
jgi:hypothetical protein